MPSFIISLTNVHVLGLYLRFLRIWRKTWTTLFHFTISICILLRESFCFVFYVNQNSRNDSGDDNREAPHLSSFGPITNFSKFKPETFIFWQILSIWKIRGKKNDMIVFGLFPRNGCPFRSKTFKFVNEIKSFWQICNKK